MAKRNFLEKNSERIAGGVSLAGSALLIMAGGPHSIAAAAFFLGAELLMLSFGNKNAGYSSSAVLFAAGDLTLAFSSAVVAGSALQLSLFAMAGFWSLGALKYPFTLAANKFNSKTLYKISDALPTACGLGNLSLRVPAFGAAALSGSGLIAIAIASWGIADVLAGRLQEKANDLYRFSKKHIPLKTKNVSI